MKSYRRREQELSGSRRVRSRRLASVAAWFGPVQGAVATVGLTLFLAAGTTGCSPAESGPAGSGGAKATSGGAPGSGGASSSGGTVGTGGISASGGSASGGAPSGSGGSIGASGGASSSGGNSSGGSSSTGGVGTGGAATGGRASGGSAGGTVGTGGGPASGGAGGGTACPGANKGLSFNGTDGVAVAMLDADLPIGDSARTVEMWVYTKATTWKGEVNTLFEYGSRAAARGVFGIDFDAYATGTKGGNLQMYVGDGTYDYFFYAGLGTATYVGWFHLASIYDPATKTWRATVNGVQVPGAMKTLTDAQTLQTQNDAVNIGRSRWYPNALTSTNPAYFDGYVDEVRIWNVARTPQQIMDNMHKRLGATPGLVANWHFDEGTGTTSMDGSGKGHTATLQGGVAWVDSSAVSLTCP